MSAETENDYIKRREDLDRRIAEAMKDQSWRAERLVYARPDSPGKRFNPEASNILTTPYRRKLGRESMRWVLRKMAKGERLWRFPDEPDVSVDSMADK